MMNRLHIRLRITRPYVERVHQLDGLVAQRLRNEAMGRPVLLESRCLQYFLWHYSDVIMGVMASQITRVSIVCSTVCSVADQRKHQSSASLAFVMGIHRWPMNSPHKGPVTRKMFPFDDVIMDHWIGRWNQMICFTWDVIVLLHYFDSVRIHPWKPLSTTTTHVCRYNFNPKKVPLLSCISTYFFDHIDQPTRSNASRLIQSKQA